RLVMGSQVKVQAQQKGFLLTGIVKNPSDAAQAVAIAKGYAGDNASINNELSITAPIQVTLSVRVAQMSRKVVRNLGINWSALGNIGRIAAISPALTLGLSGTINAVPAATCSTPAC